MMYEKIVFNCACAPFHNEKKRLLRVTTTHVKSTLLPAAEHLFDVLRFFFFFFFFFFFLVVAVVVDVGA